MKVCKNHPACTQLATHGGYCGRCNPPAQKKESTAKRGYDYRWQQLAAAVLREFPMCVLCAARRQFVTATVADHIVPFNRFKGLTREVARLSAGNVQPLCDLCHNFDKARLERAHSDTAALLEAWQQLLEGSGNDYVDAVLGRANPVATQRPRGVDASPAAGGVGSEKQATVHLTVVWTRA